MTTDGEIRKSLADRIKDYRDIGWAIGLIFLAGFTYANMSADIKAAEKEFGRLDRQFNDYAKDSRDRMNRIEQRQEQFKDDVNEIKRSLEGIRGFIEGSRPRQPQQQ